jgi:hypothetical protein
MTRIERSPEQLDAEAAGPEQRLELLIEDHRALYRADLALPRLHIRTGYTPDEEGATGPDSHIGWTGMEFTEPFLRYINWDSKSQEAGVRPPVSLGPGYAWAKAFYAQWAECRRYHREHHGRPEWRGSLCRQLVSLTVRYDLSLESACLVLGVTPARAGRTLRIGLLWIESSMDRWLKRQEEQARPLRSRVLWRDSGERHHLAGLHAEDCPQCKNGVA